MASTYTCLKHVVMVSSKYAPVFTGAMCEDLRPREDGVSVPSNAKYCGPLNIFFRPDEILERSADSLKVPSDISKPNTSAGQRRAARSPMDIVIKQTGVANNTKSAVRFTSFCVSDSAVNLCSVQDTPSALFALVAEEEASAVPPSENVVLSLRKVCDLPNGEVADRLSSGTRGTFYVLTKSGKVIVLMPDISNKTESEISQAMSGNGACPLLMVQIASPDEVFGTVATSTLGALATGIRKLFGFEARWTSVASNAEGSHAIVLDSQGRAACVGSRNDFGQLGPNKGVLANSGLNGLERTGKSVDRDQTDTRVHPVNIAEPVTEIAAGKNHCIALGRSGKVYAWGDDSKIQLGLGDTRSSTQPDTLPRGSHNTEDQVRLAGMDLSRFYEPVKPTVEYSYYQKHALATPKETKKELALVSSTGTDSYVTTSDCPGRQIAAGSDTSFVIRSCPNRFDSLRNPTVFAFGETSLGQCGRQSAKQQQIEMYMKSATTKSEYGVQSVRCGSNHCFGVTDSRQVIAWGDNKFGQLGLGQKSAGIISIPRLLDVDLSKKTSQIFASHDSTLIVLD